MEDVISLCEASFVESKDAPGGAINPTRNILLILLSAPLWAQPQVSATKAAPVQMARASMSDALQKAVQEFRVQTATLNASPNGSPTTALASSRGGERQSGRAPASRTAFHGNLYENFRNDFLDANPHEIKQRNGEKRKLRRNQWGLNLTGPVKIPKIYNGTGNTFFTFQYEGMRESIGQFRMMTIPTMPERTGSWSHVVDGAGNPLPIYDPLTTSANPLYNPAVPVTRANLQYLRQQFPGNTIPVSRLDPVAQEALKYYPEPNTAAGPFYQNNYFSVTPEVNQADGFNTTIDHSFLQKHRVTVRLARSTGINGNAPIFLTVANPANPNVNVANRSLRVEHIYTASATNINTLRFEASSNTSNNQAPLLPNGKVFPRYQFGGFGGGGGGGNFNNNNRNNQNFQNFQNNFNQGAYQNMGTQDPVTREARNEFGITDTFATRWRAHRFSLTAEVAQTQINVFRPQYPEGNFQFTAGLTQLPGIINTGHAFASFLLGGAAQVERSVMISPSYFRWNSQRYAFADQWQLTPSLTVNFSLAFKYNGQRVEKFDRQSTISLAEINPENGRPGALVAANRGGYGRAFTPNWVKLEPSLGLAWSVLGNNDTVLRLSYQRRYGEPRMQPQQFGTQAFNGQPVWFSPNQQLTPALVLAEGIPTKVFPDLRPEAANNTNADIFDTSRAQPTTQVFNASIQRQLAAFLILTVSVNREYGKNQFAGRNAKNPNAVPLSALVFRDRLNDLNFNRSLRPYPQYQDLDVANYWGFGKMRQTNVTIQIEKRTSGGLALTVAYQYGRRLDNFSSNVQNVYNLEEAWAVTQFMQPHVLNARYIYELPFGPGKAFLKRGGVLSQLFGGWSVSGSAVYASGNPLRLFPQFNNTGGVIPALYIDIVPGVDPHVKNPTPERWFNPAAFAQPPDFTPGSGPRNHPTLRGPGSYNHDVTLSKRFNLTADRTLQFDASMFNATNHANWNQPDTRIGPASAPNVNAGKIIGSTGGRIVQLGLRFNF